MFFPVDACQSCLFINKDSSTFLWTFVVFTVRTDVMFGGNNNRANCSIEMNQTNLKIELNYTLVHNFNIRKKKNKQK